MCERSALPYHLLLDFGASSTTSVKMKKLHIIAGLLVIGLLAQSGLAKTKSRNGRTQRQAYLPPRAPSSGPTITEEYIIHEEVPGSGQLPFQESNYGDGKYQIFEIHSHYEPSTASGAAHGSFNAPGYLPPQQEIRVEHVHKGAGGNGNRLQLGSSGARGISQHAVSISAHAPPSAAQAVPVPFPSSYQHDFSGSQSESVSTGSSAGFSVPAQEEIIHVEHIHVQSGGQQTGFKAPDYLPPHSGNVAVSHPQPLAPLPAPEFRAPDYLPPNNEQQHVQQDSQSHHFDVHQGSFSGPDYLPPHQEHHIQGHSTAIQSVSHQQQQQNSFAHHQQGASFKAPDYLPPHNEHHANHQAQNPAQPSGQFKGPDYLPPHQEHHHETAHQQNEQYHHISQNNQFKGPDYLPPHQTHNSLQQNGQYQVQQEQNAFKGPDYLPPHQHQNHQHEIQQHIRQPQTAYKGPDYLPPHLTTQSLHHHVQQQVQHSSTTYKGPDYLPPHQESQVQHQHVGQPQVDYQSNTYNGPPHQEQESHHQPQIPHQSTAYKGPDYLPPHHEQQSHQQSQIPHQSTAFKGPDYLPPHQESQGHQQVQHQQISFKGPDYLPPHQIEHSHNHDSHQQVQHQSNIFKGPDYLPPHQDQHSSHHVQQHQTYSGTPGSLPAGYEPHIPAVPISQPVPSQPVFQQPLQQLAQQPHTTSNLPQGYDFEKPANAEQAIAELHTLPEEHPVQQEVTVQSHIQVAQGPQQADIIYGSQQSNINYQAKGYLPPHQVKNNYQIQQGNVQAVTLSVASQQSVQQYQTSGLQQVAPQTFTPTPAAPAAQAPNSNYLPPATPVQAQQYNSNLHSLSSYMTNVQPFQRYASAPRQPFREYGPPPAAPNHGTIAQQQQHYSQPPPVAPMYREQASRPPYYAPAMSYATNAVANSHAVYHTAAQQQHITFNQQTRQNLQKFMPSDVRRPSPAANPLHVTAPAPAPATVAGPTPIRVAAPTPIHVAAPAPAANPQPTAVHSATAVPIRQSTSSKIRTVQILNPAAVKTLKVLETSDHAGVKTIKILGQTNAQPTGEHHIVKVVTQNSPNAHEHVQTVKIFDDHEESPSHSGANVNAYLPPNVRRSRQTPLKLQLLSNEKYRRPFTGRRRYRF